MVKYPAGNAGDTRDVGLIPGSGRFPGERDGSPLQHSCLGDPINGGAWQAADRGVANRDDQTAY